MKKSTLIFGLLFLLSLTVQARGSFMVNSDAGDWKFRAVRGSTLLLFYADGYDQIGRTNGVADTISFRFRTEDRVQVAAEGIHNEIVQYTTSALRGSFISCDSIRYKLANGTEVTFSLLNDRLSRRVSGNSQNPKVDFSIMVNRAIAFPPTMNSISHNSVVLIGRAGFQINERSAGQESNEFVLPEILAGADGATELRYHLPVNLQSGQFSMIWLTYVGAIDTDELLAVRDLPDGGVVVCGRTMSANFPGTDSNDSLSGSYDMVIFRMDSAGQIVWTTIFGGLYYESANGILVRDSSVYVVGATNGNDIPLINAFQDSTGGSYDAVILRMNFNGDVLQSSYFGGTGAEQGYGIDMDSTGTIVIGGSSTSSALPMSATGFQPAGGGAIDGFITTLNDSFAPQWTTFYGGTSSEDVHQLTITPHGKIVLIGASFSLNFPCTPNAFQSGRLGNCDAYYVVFDMQGNREYATYYGGSSNEDCFGVGGDAQGNIYLAGLTSSIDFNTAGVTIQSSFAGVNDAWIAKFDSTGVPVFSTFFGGGMDDKTFAMMLRGAYLYIGGSTGSSDLPVNVTAPQDSLWGGMDGFVLKMDTAGNYVTSTFAGGSGLDDIFALTVNADTMVTCAGATYSNNLQVTPGAYQSVYVGSGDGFVVRYKLSEELFSSDAEEMPAGEEPLLSVFPNPAAGDIITVACGFSISSCTLTDAEGRILSCSVQIQNNTARMNVAGLAAGVYILQVNGSDQRRLCEQVIVR